MILITGNDPIVDGLCSALDSLGRPYCRLDKSNSLPRDYFRGIPSSQL